MRFGVSIPNFGRYATGKAVVKIATSAEKLGFDSLWVSDHIVIPTSHHNGFGEEFFEPLTTLAYLVGCTQRIKLGTSVIVLPYRNPFFLAKMVSTLDVLSGGRVILGVGTGWLKDEFRALGIPYQKKGSISEEYIEILKTLWVEKSPSFKGRYFEFSNLGFYPKPLQKPYPPIWFGGNGKEAIDRAVLLANGWHPVRLTPEEVEKAMVYLKERLRVCGKENSDFTVALRANIQIVSNKVMGTANKDVLRNTKTEIVKGLRRYRDAGVSYMVLHILSGTLERFIKTLKILSKEIIPQVELV
ncbi:MAG: hypothetical protein KatS3mg078_0558 [Deltaproteobacteria bacterium]|nr:MAG: hypothetical protein KatS3mg078_0558 [Deltaproteobacteria bacterium]